MAADPVSGVAGTKATGEGTATGADDTGSTTATVCVEPPWHDVPRPRSGEEASTTGSKAASGVGVNARTAAASASPVAAGTAADDVAAEQQKSMARRKKTQPRAKGAREPYRCRSVRVLTLFIARHRSRYVNFQRQWVAPFAGQCARVAAAGTEVKHFTGVIPVNVYG